MKSRRVLSTVLFTDIVGSTERVAEMGSGPDDVERMRQRVEGARA